MDVDLPRRSLLRREANGRRGGRAGAGMREQWEHEALLRVATAASGASSLDDVIEETSEEARRAVGAASLSVSRFEKRDRQLHTLINVGELGPGEQRHPVDEAYSADDYPLVAAMLETACPYFNTLDDPYCDPMARQLLEQFGKGSDLGVPVRVEGSTWGEIWATKAVNEAPFSAEDVAFLEAIAGQYATVIARAELFSTVSRLAYEDPLTGLPNRRALDERLGRAIARARVKHDPLSLLLCDLDGLKGINDVRGHHAGDEALRAAADALVASTAFTPGSFVARLAGDEFCVVLEGIELADAVATGAAAIETLAAPGDPGLSLSCGAAAIDAGMSSAGDLLRGADTALYVAKRRGGGRVCSVAEERGEPSPRRPVGTSVGAPAHGLIVSATEQLAAELDGRLADAPALDRLEAVATAFTESGDFASWAISVSPAGTKLIADVSFGNNRDGSVRGVRVAAGTDEYALSDFPVTAALVDAGSGCFVASRSDPGSDPAERALLEELGYERVIGVAAADESDVYMIELYGDERTCSLDEVEAPLRLAARAAIPPRTRDGAASKRQVRRARASELSLALARRLATSETAQAAARATAEEVEAAYGCQVAHVVRDSGGALVCLAEAGPARTQPGWTQSSDSGLIGRCLRDDEPVLALDVRREPQFRPNVSTREIRSELVVPIKAGPTTWGVLNIEASPIAAFDAEDVRLLEAIAAQLGGALRAIDLYESLDRAYSGTAEALAAALEAKDSYTAEHSTSISKRAPEVGERLGMQSDELRFLRYGAAFHDIGKLSIPREVLNKPGPLTAEARKMIEQHTVIGERILSPVEFLRPALALVRHAHERWDGAGYPDGLAGDSIPLGARIIFACDAYDAMTTDRSYRAAMSEATAREELKRNASSQFDPEVVDALIAVLDEESRLAPTSRRISRDAPVGGG